MLTATISPRGIAFARTLLDTKTTQVGWAGVFGEPRGNVVVQATFNQAVEARPLFQTSIPEEPFFEGPFLVPSINSGGRTSSLAVVSHLAQDVTYTARDGNRIELCTATQPFILREHHAFVVRDVLPCLDGKDGTVEISGDPGTFLYATGITAHDGGAFVTQPTMWVLTSENP
jgi:hypothetical protein